MFGTKKKLMAAVVMLVISAIMMTSASYAWFTISTNPEISGLDTKVVVNKNLEIALVAVDEDEPTALPSNDVGDFNDQFTWGNIIDLLQVKEYVGDDTESPAIPELNKTLRPITITDYSATDDTPTFKYPDYHTDGRIKDLGILVNTSYGLGNLVKSGTTTDIYAYYVDFWVRTNEPGTSNELILQKAAEERSSNGDTGLGSCIWISGANPADKANAELLAKGIRIAFLDITPEIDIGTETVPNVVTTEAAEGAEPLVVTPSTTAALVDMDDDVDGNDSYAITLELAEDIKIANLEANKAKLIRMYIYYDGETLTNAYALLGNELFEANLNIQFDVANVDRSADDLT